jgi:hypothetical protein
MADRELNNTEPSRSSSVVEQWPEEPRVVSPILTFGTMKIRDYSDIVRFNKDVQ